MRKILFKSTLGGALFTATLIGRTQSNTQQPVPPTVYTHAKLEQCIGDPDYPTSALSPDGATNA